MSRGIVYLVWGRYRKDLLEKSIGSAGKFGYQYTVIDATNYPGAGFQKRMHLMNETPYDTTLHLDTDTIIKSNIDFGFEMAESCGVACCIAPASSAYHADDNGIKDIIPKDLPQYNCGVIFFDSAIAVPTFVEWGKLLRKYPESMRNDQPYFSYAVYGNLVTPYVLPKTWNLRPHTSFECGKYHGQLKILHSRYKIR
jgi:hypothetical protein